MEPIELYNARQAYQRYGAVTDFKNFQGNPMPAFHELPEKIREAWVAVANAPLTVGEINAAITGLPEGGANYVSDGYHSFGELYDKINKMSETLRTLGYESSDI